MHEEVRSILEYAPNKLIASVWKIDLLLIQDWKFVNVIKEDQPGNGDKFWIDLMPNFD